MEVQADKLPDSKLSAKIRSEPLDVFVDVGVLEGVGVLVGVGDGLIALVGVRVKVAVGLGVLVGVIEGVNVLVGVGDGPFVLVGVRVKVAVGVFVGAPGVFAGSEPVDNKSIASTSLAASPQALPSKYRVDE